MNPISLTVPARSEFVSLARTVVANAAAHLKMTFDQVDDLRLAADEAVSQLIQLPGASTLNLQIQLNQDSIEIRSWVDAQPTDWPPAELDGSLTWQILSGLVAEATFERNGEDAAIRFRSTATTSA